MHHQLRTIVKLASSILLLSLISPPQGSHDPLSNNAAVGVSSSMSIMMVQAAVVPGRMLNSNHEEIFAQQAKELQKTKSKGRKPFLACPAGLIPCLSQADAEPEDDVYECVDVTSSLQSCGGCSMHRNEDGEVEVAGSGSTTTSSSIDADGTESGNGASSNGMGIDCTSLRNVKGVECYDSRCLISEHLPSHPKCSARIRD
ncbi:hypothetical protein P389DRAFT_15993 [Cystobasidium minutum MCA 4210]|uniref:uncharacterized protein n=1 Tax=Cystobasidium minutum MCA 4210 TaxID=1397322 RepID=UPI0034D00DFE|eukprot:jgi/Rhomi1/15993/CE15992_1583